MGEINYGEHKQQADLVGKSVAEARELYKSAFSIPNRARVSLNGKQLKRKLESAIRLSGDDNLSFEVPSRRGLVMLGAFMLTLAVTSGVFAFTYTTTSKTITVGVGAADFASITDNGTSFDYTILGRHRGAITGGTLFNVTRTTGYTGDMEVNVYLSNIDELTRDYSFWMMRLQLQNNSGTPVDVEGITQVLSLDSPVVSFAVDNWTANDRYVVVLGGSYRAFPFAWLSGEDPVLFGQVVQAGP